MNFDKFKEKFENLCRSIGGKFKREKYQANGELEVLTCYDIPEGKVVSTGLKGSELVLKLHGEELELGGLNETTIYFEKGWEVWIGQDRGFGNGSVVTHNVEKVNVMYNKTRNTAHVSVYTRK